MTFLELCQATRQDCGVSGTGPSAVTGQVGELKRIVDWVALAWLRIQSLHHDWKFLRLSASWTSVAGQAIYTTAECGITAGTFSRWIPHTFRTYLTAAGTDGEFHLAQMGYEAWRETWQFNANRNVQSQPWQVAITPDDSVALGPKPLAGYTMTGDYYRAPVRLAAGDDVPALPAKHDPYIIVARACMLYGAHESAPEVYALGKEEYTARIASLRADQLPPPVFGGPLA